MLAWELSLQRAVPAKWRSSVCGAVSPPAAPAEHHGGRE